MIKNFVHNFSDSSFVADNQFSTISLVVFQACPLCAVTCRAAMFLCVMLCAVTCRASIPESRDSARRSPSRKAGIVPVCRAVACRESIPESRDSSRRSPSRKARIVPVCHALCAV